MWEVSGEGIGNSFFSVFGVGISGIHLDGFCSSGIGVRSSLHFHWYAIPTSPAEQLFPYVFPSIPHTGAYILLHIRTVSSEGVGALVSWRFLGVCNVGGGISGIHLDGFCPSGIGVRSSLHFHWYAIPTSPATQLFPYVFPSTPHTGE